MSLLSCRGLSVRFGPREVLHGIDFEARAGELVGLIGPNGAGKTTLARALTGLAAAASGTVFLEGAPLESFGRRQRARAIGYLAQSGEIGWPVEVRRVVELGRSAHRPAFAKRPDDDRAIVEAAMTAADVQHLRSRRATALSGGERARVLIARVLAGEPKIILADEPVSALDPYHQLQIMDLLKGHARGGGGAVVVLHDLALASRFCDRLVLLDKGKAVADGSPREILTDETLSRVYRVRARTIGGEKDANDGFAVLPWARVNSSAVLPARNPAEGSGE